MLSFALWKKLAVFGALALGLLYAVPNFIDAPEEGGLASILPGQSVNLGLDLQGGSYLLLKVDMEKVERERLSDIAENLRSYLRSQRAGFNGLKSDDKQTVFRLRKEEDKQKLTQFFNELGREFNVTNVNLSYQIAYTEEGLFALAGRTVEQSIEIVRKRLDPDGTKEPLIQRQGRDRILIQLPGVDDPERIKRLIGRTAKLSFQLVDPRISASEARQQGRVPPGSTLLEGMKEGDAAVAGAKAGLASRTNTLFSVPMLMYMVYSVHGGGVDISMNAVLVGLAIIFAIEANAIWGKMLPAITSVRAVITSSFILAVVMKIITDVM